MAKKDKVEETTEEKVDLSTKVKPLHEAHAAYIKEVHGLDVDPVAIFAVYSTRVAFRKSSEQYAKSKEEAQAQREAQEKEKEAAKAAKKAEREAAAAEKKAEKERKAAEKKAAKEAEEKAAEAAKATEEKKSSTKSSTKSSGKAATGKKKPF